MNFDAADRKTIAWALLGWANACHDRANEIAQDTQGRLTGRDGKPLPKSAIGEALDEAKHAEKLALLFSEDSANG
jgi:hypothetical protein